MLRLACLPLALNDGNSNTIQFKGLVCSLHFTLSLHFMITPGMQCAVCNLQFVFYTDRLNNNQMESEFVKPPWET